MPKYFKNPFNMLNLIEVATVVSQMTQFFLFVVNWLIYNSAQWALLDTKVTFKKLYMSVKCVKLNTYKFSNMAASHMLFFLQYLQTI